MPGSSPGLSFRQQLPREGQRSLQLLPKNLMEAETIGMMMMAMMLVIMTAMGDCDD